MTLWLQENLNNLFCLLEMLTNSVCMYVSEKEKGEK